MMMILIYFVLALQIVSGLSVAEPQIQSFFSKVDHGNSGQQVNSLSVNNDQTGKCDWNSIEEMDSLMDELEDEDSDAYMPLEETKLDLFEKCKDTFAKGLKEAWNQIAPRRKAGIVALKETIGNSKASYTVSPDRFYSLIPEPQIYVGMLTHMQKQLGDKWDPAAMINDKSGRKLFYETFNEMLDVCKGVGNLLKEWQKIFDSFIFDEEFATKIDKSTLELLSNARICSTIEANQSSIADQAFKLLSNRTPSKIHFNFMSNPKPQSEQLQLTDN